jgi:hypothetical protein
MAINFHDSYPIVHWNLNQHTLFKYYFGSVDDSANGFKLQILQNDSILIPTTEEVYFYFEKHDHTHGYIKATIEDDYFVVDLTNQVYAVEGKVKCNFQITSNSKWRTSPEFIIKVDENNIQDSIESSNDFIAFQQALNKLGDITADVNTVISKANTAISNANTATGNANTATQKALYAAGDVTASNNYALQSKGWAIGDTSISGSSTNNSKYYSEQAANSAILASQYATIVYPNLYIDITTGELISSQGTNISFSIDSNGYLISDITI